MFKKLSTSEVRASIIPFDYLFMTDEHKSSEDYTIIREAIKPLDGNTPSEK